MAQKKFKKQYFLFGEIVSRELEREGLKAALKMAKINGYSIFEWNENSTPVELLNEAEGWEGWNVITKRQYDAFAKL